MRASNARVAGVKLVSVTSSKPPTCHLKTENSCSRTGELVTATILFSLLAAARRYVLVGVSVSPDAGGYPDATIRLANTTGNQVTFTVTNTGDIDTRYSVTCTPGVAVSSITACPTIGIIAAGNSKPASVSFTTGSA